MSSVLTPIALKHLLSRDPYGPWLGFVDAGNLIGVIAAIRVGRAARQRSVAWGLLLLWLFVAVFMGASIWTPTPRTGFIAAVALFATATLMFRALVSLQWLAREEATGAAPHFAFFMLGSTLATMGYWSVVEPFFSLREQWIGGWVAFALVGVGYGCLYAMQDFTATAPSPTSGLLWPDRLRWAILGGLPAVAFEGAVQTITIEISPMPVFWILPAIILMLSTIRAFASMTTRKMTLVGAVVQILALWVVVIVATSVIVLTADFEATIWITVGVAAIVGVLAMPHRWTIVAQAVMASLIVANTYSTLREVPYLAQILLHLLACAAAAWGCQGAAVQNVTTPARVAEYLLWTTLGAALLGAAYRTIPGLAGWVWMIEYPAIHVACFLARLWPAMAGKPGPDAR